MESLMNLIKDHPFFEGMDPEYAVKIAGFSSEKHFEPDEMIFRHGEEEHKVYLMIDGKVAVEIISHHNKKLIIQTIGEGDVLGWSWFFPPYLSHFNARALKEIKTIAIDAKRLRELSEEDYKFGYELYKRIASIIVARLESTRIQLLDVYI